MNTVLLTQLGNQFLVLELTTTEKKFDLAQLRHFTYQLVKRYLNGETLSLEAAYAECDFTAEDLSGQENLLNRLTWGESMMVFGHNYRLMGGRVVFHKPVWVRGMDAANFYLRGGFSDTFINSNLRYTGLGWDELRDILGYTVPTMRERKGELEKIANALGYQLT